MYELLKRIVDIVGSIVGIILFSIPMSAVAIFIKTVSPEGPVFADTKKRVGRDGREFTMLKFRSMKPNAQEWLKSQPELYKKYQDNGYKLDPDPRLIKGGNFLRKTSIDELPQFFNVLAGTMSLVGHRAYFKYELDEQCERYPEAKKYVDDVLTTKPGMTGPWQIGGRSTVGFMERVKMDSDYAKCRSVLYDLLVILKTPYVVLTRRGAV